MKKTKFLLGIGACMLTLVGIASTKANKKFAGVSAASFIGVTGLNSADVTGLGNTHFTTIKGAGAVTVFLRTAVSNTKIGTLVTANSTTKKVYYH